jgi:hypothetical protein
MGDKMVLFHSRTNRFFELNRTGARLWEWLAEEPEPGRLVERLTAEFTVSASEAAAEVERWLQALCAEELVGCHDER